VTDTIAGVTFGAVLLGGGAIALAVMAARFALEGGVSTPGSPVRVRPLGPSRPAV
jgi:hypothetical protein